jgi:hypothetical protein
MKPHPGGRRKLRRPALRLVVLLRGSGVRCVAGEGKQRNAPHCHREAGRRKAGLQHEPRFPEFTHACCADGLHAPPSLAIVLGGGG